MSFPGVTLGLVEPKHGALKLPLGQECLLGMLDCSQESRRKLVVDDGEILLRDGQIEDKHDALKAAVAMDFSKAMQCTNEPGSMLGASGRSSTETSDAQAKSSEGSEQAGTDGSAEPSSSAASSESEAEAADAWVSKLGKASAKAAAAAKAAPVAKAGAGGRDGVAAVAPKKPCIGRGACRVPPLPMEKVPKNDKVGGKAERSKVMTMSSAEKPVPASSSRQVALFGSWGHWSRSKRSWGG